MLGAGKQIRKRLRSLEHRLEQENPLLVSAVHSFRKLDRVGYAMGLLGRDESYATQIAWWPLVSILGTFSAGKSTFINHYIGYSLQATGNQAVDDKFTVICFSRDATVQELPGVALDADPRFPFYQMSEELEKVAEGEGRRVEAYLQMRTCPSETLRGLILIDSPGFDADAQRTATLRITDYIIDLSDLVLVLFDARHPEPGAMQDTLKHLVGDTVRRADSSKFLYILNQIDTTAREDNPEEVVGAWQRAIAQEGLTAGRFYCIYNPEAAVPIEDDALRHRYETKRDQDLQDIHARIKAVSVERAYRIMGALENTAKDIENETVPRLREYIHQWARGTLWRDGILGVLVLAVLLGGSIALGWWQGFPSTPTWMEWFLDLALGWKLTVGVLLLALLAGLHFLCRGLAAKRVVKRIIASTTAGRERDGLVRAFMKNTSPWRSIFSAEPAGWGRRARRRLEQVQMDADRYVQVLNDRFTDPSGDTPVPLREPTMKPYPESSPQPEKGPAAEPAAHNEPIQLAASDVEPAEREAGTARS